MSRVGAFPWTVAVAAAWLVLGCGPDRVAGGGTETGNADVVSGRILDSDGRGVASVLVNLEEVKTLPDGSEPGARHSVRTDAAGKYRFEDVQAGKYALLAPGFEEHPQAAILTRIEKKDSLLSLPDAVYRQTVTLVGRVFPAVGSGLADMQVCVPGMHACVRPGADSVWTVALAPKGAYEILFLTPTAAHYLAVQVRAETGSTVYVRDAALRDSADADHMPFRFYDLPQALSFSLVPRAYAAGAEPAWYAGKTFADVNYFLLADAGPVAWNPDFLSAWKYARLLDGDSLRTGADLAQPLAGFPLPIRLTAADFDFSQARSDGGDLVFADSAGRLLPFEIERWDAAAKRAEIWVRMDTLAAAKADRKLSMRWGNPYATPHAAGGADVFRASEGFLGAWHFAGLAGTVPEARGLFPGTFTGPAPAGGYAALQTPDGQVGPALALGRTGDYAHIADQPALDVAKTFTVSVWARLAQPDNGRKQLLAAKWQAAKREWHFDLWTDRTFELELGDAAGNIQGNWRSTAPVKTPDQWHLYAAVYDKGAVKLYLDGAEVPGAVVAGGTLPTAINQFHADITLGSNSIDTTLNLQGDLDEFRLYSTAKSKDWMDMEFRTGK